MYFNNLGKISLFSLLVLFSGSVFAKNLAHPRIIGGDKVTTAYDWMVSIQTKSHNEHFCGGTLIASRWVLTAAHCVEQENAENIQVVIGAIDISDSSDGEKRNVQHIIIHPDYGKEFDLDNDIALLKLTQDSSKTPVTLASAEETANLQFGFSEFLVMGWGATNGVNLSYPDILHSVNVPYVQNSSCASAINIPLDDLDNDIICAGYADGRADSCFADSGGPLLFDDNGTLKHTGIVSFGTEQCASYGGYTKTASYLDWINQTMNGPALLGDGYFGYLGVGSSKSLTFEILNSHNSAITIASVFVSGANAALFTITDNCTGSLNANATCIITVEANATTAGLLEATLNVETSTILTKDLSIIALKNADLGSALDNESLQWFTGGAADWGVNSKESRNGAYSIASGSIQDNQASVLLVNVEGISQLSASIKVSSEEGYDGLIIFIDDTYYDFISGDVDWTGYNFQIPNGAKQMLFAYLKDANTTVGHDRAWIDNVSTNLSVAVDNSDENKGKLGVSGGGG